MRIFVDSSSSQEVQNYPLQDLRTLRVRFDQEICFLQMYRPEANNTLNGELIRELTEILDLCENSAKIIVLEGLPEVFCFGADFNGLQQTADNGQNQDNLQHPEPLYNILHRLSAGPYITVAHVRGKANAGGIGLVAACDIVLSEEKAVFSLSELLFGLIPACVLPFLIRRIGFAKANYMTLMTQPVSAEEAQRWGLIDAIEADSENLLRKHLLRLRRLNKKGISRYKMYMNTLDTSLSDSKTAAIKANIEVFTDKENLEKIARYVKTGQLPWETDR